MSLFIRIYNSAILILLATMCFASEKTAVTVFNQKPYFTLNFTTAGCAYEVRINDIPVAADPEGIAGSSTLSINEWLFSGENTFSLYLNPLQDAKELIKSHQACIVTASIQVRNINADASENKTVFEITYSSKDPLSLTDEQSAVAKNLPEGSYVLTSKLEPLKENEKVQIYLGKITLLPSESKNGKGIVVNRTFVLPKLPFPKWEWLNGETLADIDFQKKNWKDFNELGL